MKKTTERVLAVKTTKIQTFKWPYLAAKWSGVMPNILTEMNREPSILFLLYLFTLSKHILLYQGRRRKKTERAVAEKTQQNYSLAFYFWILVSYSLQYSHYLVGSPSKVKTTLGTYLNYN